MNATPAQNIDTASIVGHFINGASVADANRPMPVTNPATGEITRHVAMASKATVEDAISAAGRRSPPGAILHLRNARKSCSDSKRCLRKTPTRSSPR